MKKKLFKLLLPIYKIYLWLFDSRQIEEMSGKRVVFAHLKKTDKLNGFKNKRILEIGPKYGTDSVLLADLKPKELFLLDLPEKTKEVKKWLPKLKKKCKVSYREGNLLYLTKKEMENMGKFDLVWCLGALYHNVEQIRLLKKIYDLCAENGMVVVESATTRNSDLENMNVVEIHWPKTYRMVQTITHLPSRLAILSWLEMVGFSDVKIIDVYSQKIKWQRAVLTARKNSETSAYISYNVSGLNSPYVAGAAV